MALSRAGKLTVLGAAAAGLVGLLVVNLRESRTIVVGAQSHTGFVPSGTLVGALVAPTYYGRATNGSQWALTAAQAQQSVTNNSQTPHRAAQAEISLTTLSAEFTQPEQAPLYLSAPAAHFTPHSSQLGLPQGVGISGTTGGYLIALQATRAEANLSASTFAFTGGVSATLMPR